MLVGKEKGVVRAPTPEPPPPGQKVTPAPKRKNSMSDKKKKSPPSKYEPLALSYANRSAALRRYGHKTVFLLYKGGYFKDERSVGGRGVGKMRSVLVIMMT